ncbi:hypothetical protein [Streptomyces sp. NBC_01500]|uniref:hypothetical protein n=1 Tax=Streptomyces sp. NBC_01500 TaxID=2903886 RepID=UPI0022530570|nr:hypothetical protein [Streptomyces sp. NBC_01500]MCX4554228.1 hypothetical protein [Streptomyces sp. NBC_01500]
MTATAHRSPWALLAGTGLLLFVGLVLLAPHDDRSGPGSGRRSVAAIAPPRVSPSASARARVSFPPATPVDGGDANRGPAPSGGAVPDRGDGPAGDPAIQRVLDRSWPADLPAADERQLRVLGSALLRRDATGAERAGRAVVVPAFTRFRIQAVIARRAGSRDAVVHLVWAGADRGGTFTDGRITDLYFHSTETTGARRWTQRSAN